MTASFDREQKAAVYAASDIAEYWIADINRRVFRQLWAPERGAYVQYATVDFNQEVGSRTIAGLAIDTGGF